MSISYRLPLAAVALSLSTVPMTAQAQTQAQPSAAAAPAAAQTPEKRFAPGVGVVNRDAVILASNAMRNATSERQIVYKNQLAMAEARRKQINAQIEPLVKKFNEDKSLGSASTAELQEQAQAIQTLQQSGVQELNTMLAPVRLSEAYVQEQVLEAFGKAIVTAMDKRGITLVFPPQTFLAYNNAYIIDADVLAELNALLPTAMVVAPDGWRPRAEREAAAAQQQTQQARPAQNPPASRRRN